VGIRIFDTEYTQAKSYFDGTHRARGPAETLRDYRRFMKPMGITRLANVTGLDCVGLPVYIAVRPNSRLLAVSQGKGIDHDTAKVSALMESIETWHAENIRQPVRVESLRALRRSANVVDVDALPRLRSRPLLDHVPIPWIEGYDVIRDRRVWVPAEVVDLNSVRPADYVPVFVPDSNGLASGNHLLEAVAHALCEVIERDATALWFTDVRDETGGKATQLDASSVSDPYCRAMLERLARADLIAGLYDATSDVGVPVYNVVIFERPGAPRTLGYFWGFGCHLSPAVALSRALSEAVQCRLTEISGSRDDIDPGEYAKNRDEHELREMAGWVCDAPAPLRFDARPDLAAESFEADVRRLCDGLLRAGLGSAVVVDLSREDVGIPVVKVVVPGLEGVFGPNYVAGPRARRLVDPGRERVVAA
jgi:YcaO-like protein with predicted kinase domain